MKSLSYDPNKRQGSLDEYLTPPELVRACVEKMCGTFDPEQELVVVDSGANWGVWGWYVKQIYPNAKLIGVEILDMPKPVWYDEWYIADYLTWQPTFPVDMVVGNPPYSLRTDKRITVADKFVKHSLDLLDNYKGYVYYLLRSGFRHSLERYKNRDGSPGLLQTHHYKQAYNTTRRPSFYKYDKRTEHFGTTRTNSHEYTLYAWDVTWKEQFAFERPLDWDYDKENEFIQELNHAID